MDRKGDDDDDRFHIAIFSIFCLAVTWLVPHETTGISMRSVYTIQTCTMSRHFTQSHVRRVHEFVGREREMVGGEGEERERSLPPALLAE